MYFSTVKDDSNSKNVKFEGSREKASITKANNGRSPDFFRYFSHFPIRFVPENRGNGQIEEPMSFFLFKFKLG